MKTTKYPRSRRGASTRGKIAVLKRAKGTNGKLGDRVVKGRWKGLPIYALTLTERETCPATCHHWEDCFGNHMPFAHRWRAGSALERAVEAEVAAALQRHPEGIVVRLHVLGDFYSVGYVRMWQRLLERHRRLRIFGYTARPPRGTIGREVVKLNRAWTRCVIRFSVKDAGPDRTRTRRWAVGEDAEASDAFGCPEQTGQAEDCARCAACWQSLRPVKFFTH